MGSTSHGTTVPSSGMLASMASTEAGACRHRAPADPPGSGLQICLCHPTSQGPQCPACPTWQAACRQDCGRRRRHWRDETRKLVGHPTLGPTCDSTLPIRRLTPPPKGRHAAHRRPQSPGDRRRDLDGALHCIRLLQRAGCRSWRVPMPVRLRPPSGRSCRVDGGISCQCSKTGSVRWDAWFESCHTCWSATCSFSEPASSGLTVLLRLRSKRGKLLEEISSRMRWPVRNVWATSHRSMPNSVTSPGSSSSSRRSPLRYRARMMPSAMLAQ
jgi:hypothetical protein